jgi:uncharacterized protein (TIGR00730 family)
MNVIVLAGGSAERGPTPFTRAAEDFGRRVAAEGWVLRTGGGGGTSIMGAASDGALAAGGRVEGVILGKFWKARHRGLHSMHAYSTFALRKQGLFRGASATVVFPGGYGTLDELGDIVVLRQTGFIPRPVLLMNLSGFYDDFLRWERRAAKEGFLYGKRQFRVARTPAQAVGLLRTLL